MRACDILNELGDSTYPGYPAVNDDDYIEYHTEGGPTVYLNKSGFSDITIEFTVKGRSDITGSGNAFKILSTVGQVISKYLPNMVDEHTNTVSFTADNREDSRVSLYRNRVVPRISNILGADWRYEEVQEPTATKFQWVNARAELDETQLDLFKEPPRVFYVLINGKLWRKSGKPVEFDSFASADKAVVSIINNYGKAAQVVDPRRWPGVINT